MPIAYVKHLLTVTIRDSSVFLYVFDDSSLPRTQAEIPDIRRRFGSFDESDLNESHFDDKFGLDICPLAFLDGALVCVPMCALRS